MSRKVIIIIIFIAALGLIGAGLFFTMTDKDSLGFGPISSSKDEDIVDVLKELEDNEDVHTENINKYKTIEDATSFLINTYQTANVVVSYNDGEKATIKVFADTEEEIKYNYYFGPGDLIIDF